MRTQRWGQALAALREGAGLSKRQLALRSNVLPSYVTKIEQGQRMPSVEVLDRMARECGVSFAVLAAKAATSDERAELESWLARQRHLAPAGAMREPEEDEDVDEEEERLEAALDAVREHDAENPFGYGGFRDDD